MIRRPIAILAALLLLSGRPADAAMRFTEWMYSGGDGEFIEMTNVGGPAIDFTGWSFDDSSRTAGAFSLSSFGTVQPGESVILCEPDAATFRASWNLAPAVKIIGLNDQNLGRSDELNLYDAASALIDRLTYNDQGTGNVAGPRTQDSSGNPQTLSALGANVAAQWKLATNGDAYGSYAGLTAGNLANPGKFLLVPEPSALALAAWGLVSLRRRRVRADRC